MPSPIAHATMGYVIYHIYQRRLSYKGSSVGTKLPRVLLVTIALSLLPDLDGVAGLLMGDFGRFHNNAIHSLGFGLLAALILAGVVWWRKRSRLLTWFMVALLCFEMHVLMDYVTIGRGVMLFWPFTSARFGSPLILFYGLHWSDGLVSLRHVWTLATELAFTLTVLLTLRFLPSYKRRGASR